MPTSCPFCRIVKDDASAHRVMADDDVMAFLDVRPLFPGHTLVVPRQHHETLADLPPDRIPHLFAVVRDLSAVMEDELGAGGSFVAVNNRVSQSVPHLHVHVVPRTKGDGLRGFFWPRTRYENDDAAAEMAARLAAGYRARLPS
jgi:histidine triad (HIT) family protein